MDVFCIGMPRSASTWQYAVTCALLERHGSARRMGFFDSPDHVAQFISDHPPSLQQWRVFKTHAPPSDWLAERLAAGEARAVYSFRDLRDVAFSLAHKLTSSFEKVIESRRMEDMIAADSFWQGRSDVLSQRYETLFAKPVRAIEEIATYLGIKLATDEAAALAKYQSLEANRSRANELADQLRANGVDLSDPSRSRICTEGDLLGWNHIRSGAVGGWKTEATPRQLAILAVVCGRWLIERAYETDVSWAAPALAYLTGLTNSIEPSGEAWESGVARTYIQASIRRKRSDRTAGDREFSGDDSLARAADSACLQQLQETLHETTQELEFARQAYAHFRTCHDAVRDERDFLRGQLDASDEELKFLREQWELLTKERAELLAHLNELESALAKRTAA